MIRNISTALPGTPTLMRSIGRTSIAAVLLSPSANERSLARPDDEHSVQDDDDSVAKREDDRVRKRPRLAFSQHQQSEAVVQHAEQQSCEMGECRYMGWLPFKSQDPLLPTCPSGYSRAKPRCTTALHRGSNRLGPMRTTRYLEKQMRTRWSSSEYRLPPISNRKDLGQMRIIGQSSKGLTLVVRPPQLSPRAPGDDYSFPDLQSQQQQQQQQHDDLFSIDQYASYEESASLSVYRPAPP